MSRGAPVPDLSASDAPGVEWGVVAIVVVAVGWAVWFVVSTATNPYDEPEAVALIRPLLYGLVAVAPFAIASAIGRGRARLAPDDPAGLAVPARARFLGLLAAFAPLIWALGYPLAIGTFLAAALVALGERRALVIAPLALGLAALAGYVFPEWLGVRLPLLPFGLR